MTSPIRKHTVLIIDDDRLMCDIIRRDLARDNLEVVTAHTAADGLCLCRQRQVDVVLLDQKLPDSDGVSLCAPILSLNEHAKIIFITAYPSFENAVQAVRQGACDYLAKPFELEELTLRLQNALRVIELERVASLHSFQRAREDRDTLLVGQDAGLREVHRLITLAAESDASGLITGETGVGKSVAAKLIHQSSARRSEAFIRINCAALPENLMEAEMFGYEKGAFTGAVNARKGLFEMAEGGTLFLDEIGEMPLHLQSKLLGVLDDKIVRRLGGERPKRVETRILAATGLDMGLAVKTGRFRRDLYYRLGVILIDMPPLRSHPEDIAALCQHFISKLRPGARVSVPADELEKLQRYGWPGNIRELKNIIERSLILSNGGGIRPSQLIESPVLTDEAPRLEAGDMTLPCTLKEMEAQHIRRVLAFHRGNHTRSARTLDISRTTLLRKLQTLKISSPSD